MADIHTMLLTERAPSGDEEWACTRCARRTLVRWVPGFRMVVLEQGEPDVPHAGSKGGVGMGTVSVTPSPSKVDRTWLQRSGIDWDGLAGPASQSA